MTDLHLLRPEWLWSLLALPLLWFTARRARPTRWENYIDRTMLAALRIGGKHGGGNGRWLLLGGWLLATLAAAGPSWQQLPTPSLRNQSALVILLDLSRSMLATDLTPDRITRARFKVADILRARRDGQTALIAYAGDPHTVSPLTDDVRTIEALLPALHPTIMPVPGSNTEAAVEMAQALLESAGQRRADILLLTDGVAPAAQRTIVDRLKPGVRLSILGIGSPTAVPIPAPGGGFLRNAAGAVVSVRLNRAELQTLAKTGGGRYAELQADESDIAYLLAADPPARAQFSPESRTQYDGWQDAGHWLVLALLPLAAWQFRRGALFALPPLLALPLLLASNPAAALTWEDLWLRPDQRAHRLLEADQPAAAAELFRDKRWRGAAHYRAGNHAAAAADFAADPSLRGTYNRGLALAQQGQIPAAIAAFGEVLERDPEHADAHYNKSLLEDLLERQQAGQGENSEQGEGSQSEIQQGQTQEGESTQAAQASESKEEGEQGEQAAASQAQDEENAEQSDQPTAQPGADDAEAETEEDPDQLLVQDQEASDESTETLSAPSEQWLRTIPDDPSGLLRRKFDHASRQRRASRPPQNAADERY